MPHGSHAGQSGNRAAQTTFAKIVSAFTGLLKFGRQGTIHEVHATAPDATAIAGS